MIAAVKFLVTGGAGFIGSAVVRYLVDHTGDSVVNVDKLTYAGNLESVASVADSDRYRFERIDIRERAAIDRVFAEHSPDLVMHLAAESHVDRSIDGAAEFIETNIVGTYTLLEATREYWQQLDARGKRSFRFHHVSTDEVYGDLDSEENPFTESTAYDPSSPYSASKACSDHLVRAWGKTYNLPVVISNCSNNYGPFHFPEKLVPLMILNGLEGKPMPVYGDGRNVRDWLYVEDHVRALRLVATQGRVGETYNIGGNNEISNIDVVRSLCRLMDELVAEKPAGIDQFEELITFVEDRRGHDRRYAIDATKIRGELGWQPEENFASGIRKTVNWYLHNESWWRRVQDGSYSRERLGLGVARQ